MTKYNEIDPEKLVELLNIGATLGNAGGGGARYAARQLGVSPQAVIEWMRRYNIRVDTRYSLAQPQLVSERTA